MVLLKKPQQTLLGFFKQNYNCKFRFTSKFTSKFMLQYGLHFGGHVHLLNIETSSIIFGIRNCNIIINLNFTALELLNVLKIVKGLGLKRCMLYFINSTLSFRLSFKYSFKNFNRHLFFPVYKKITHILRNRKKKDILKLSASRNLQKKSYYFFRSGQNLLRKMFIVSKWSNGFLSNSRTFFMFTKNVLHEKVKLGKTIDSFEQKMNSLADFYPLLPHYGFIGDNKKNFFIVNEFNKVGVPNSSVIDTFTTKALYAIYGIPGNACSIDSTLFFLILTISNYLLGFYKQIIRYCLDIMCLKEVKLHKFLKKKKNFFFKRFKLSIKFINNFKLNLNKI